MCRKVCRDKRPLSLRLRSRFKTSLIPSCRFVEAIGESTCTASHEARFTHRAEFGSGPRNSKTQIRPDLIIKIRKHGTRAHVEIARTTNEGSKLLIRTISVVSAFQPKSTYSCNKYKMGRITRGRPDGNKPAEETVSISNLQ